MHYQLTEHQMHRAVRLQELTTLERDFEMHRPYWALHLAAGLATVAAVHILTQPTDEIDSYNIQIAPQGFGSIVDVSDDLPIAVEPGTLPFIGLSTRMKNAPWGDPGQAGFAGQAHAPFAPNAEQARLGLTGISVESLRNRKLLLNEIDRLKREAETNGALEGLESQYQAAFGILTSSKLVDALDLEQEDPAIRDRYGRGAPENAGYGDAGPLMNDYLLAARRLVEAGARVVTLAYGRWDWHGRPHGTNFENARDHLPVFDQGLSALLDDLRDRNLDQDVSVIVWGEFGRTPVINKNGGRDHWPQVACAWLAGGGMRMGQVIGSTNRLGEHPKERPVHFQEIFATLYRNLGIDTSQTLLPDLSGRPQYLVDPIYEPLPELF